MADLPIFPQTLIATCGDGCVVLMAGQYFIYDKRTNELIGRYANVDDAQEHLFRIYAVHPMGCDRYTD